MFLVALLEACSDAVFAVSILMGMEFLRSFLE